MFKNSYRFFLMFNVVLLLNVNYTILRSLRNTLAVIDLGAGTIPVFELFGALPASIFMTWCLGKLMNRITIHKVFLFLTLMFIVFFLIFAFCIQPLTKSNYFFSMTFYVVSELWKPSLAIILFWGLVNQHISMLDAKKLFAPLMLAGSLGSVLAGPIVSYCTSEKCWKYFPLSTEQWSHAFVLMILIVAFIGVITTLILSVSFNSQEKCNFIDKRFSLKGGLSICIQIPQLRTLSWIVIADYIAYSLGEVIFLDVLKLKFPHACDYCNYMGTISAMTGALTVLSALFVTPFILQRYRWVFAALLMPICLLATEGAFFIFLRGNLFSLAELQWIEVVVFLGSFQYCICRALKYTLFDASKELAFVMMPSSYKMSGKLIIDGICARFGRGCASTLSMGLIGLFGGVLASSFLTGLIALGVTLSWLSSTLKLGKLLDPAKEAHV